MMARAMLVKRAVIGAASFVFLIFSAASAQQVDPSSILQQVLKSGGQSGSTIGVEPQQDTKETVLQPQVDRRMFPLPPSRLEQMLSQRTGAKLELFGYDQLGYGRSVSVPQVGAVQDDYVLGPGDELIVSLRGQENGEFRVGVNRNGQVILPRLSPISASGRTLGDFRQELARAVHRSYVATEVFASLGRIRQASVTVAGEVNIPGQRIVTGLSSPIDAILLSGGVKKSGSLRNVRLIRGGQQYNIDLYSYLTSSGHASKIKLTDGDRIVVPPLGKVVAVSGLVRRAGIYELPAGTSSISGRNLIALGGGMEVRGTYNLSVLRIGADGRTELAALPGPNAIVRDSEVLFVQPGADETVNRTILSGGSPLAGSYSLGNKTTLSSLLKAPGALGRSPYTLFGVISRKDPRTLLRTLIPFTPVAVINGTEDLPLQSDDVVRVLSVSETRLITRVLEAYVGKQQIASEVLRNPQQISSQNQSAVPGDASNPQRYVAPPDQGDLMTEYLLAQRSRGGAPTERDQIDALSTIEMGDSPGVVYGSLSAQPSNQVGQVPVNTAGSTEAQAQQQQLQMQMQVQQQQMAAAGLASGYPGSSTIERDVTPGAYRDQYATTGQSPQQATPQFNQMAALPPNFQQQSVRAGQSASNEEARNFGTLAQQLGIEPLVLVNFLADNRVTVGGAVRAPGVYFAGPHVELSDLVAAAGGASQWADQRGVEIVSTAIDGSTGQAVTTRNIQPLRVAGGSSYIIRPQDHVRLNQIYTEANAGMVQVQGEVRSAGNYQFVRGERLSDLLARAGGLTSVAYPLGTIFLRKSAASMEKEGYMRAARDIEAQLLVGMTKIGADKISPDAFKTVQMFVTQLRTQVPLGRVSIVADPAVLASKPELDPLLEPGDVVYIPQRPSTVAVLGEVMQPGSYQFRTGADVRDYIAKSGGYGSFADSSMTFLVLPDGTARRADSSWLNFSGSDIPPGSAIVVPRDISPLDLRQIMLDATSVFSQLAVSAASLAVLSRN